MSVNDTTRRLFVYYGNEWTDYTEVHRAAIPDIPKESATMLFKHRMLAGQLIVSAWMLNRTVWDMHQSLSSGVRASASAYTPAPTSLIKEEALQRSSLGWQMVLDARRWPGKRRRICI